MHPQTLRAANNCVATLRKAKRFEEAKALLRKLMPVAGRVLDESDWTTLRMRRLHAGVLYEDPGATLDDLREAVTTLEELAPIARRVLGGAHPLTVGVEGDLQGARAALHHARDRGDVESRSPVKAD